MATAVDCGDRDNQEDAVVADFPIGETCGLAVLADGMGGHGNGDIASSIVATEVFAELRVRRRAFKGRESEISNHLRQAADEANSALQLHVEANPKARGMGTTLIATVLVGPHLYWLSVGDSPLYLYRKGEIERLNEDHSMAPHIDAMVASGQLSVELAENHPERNTLTSAISGEKIARIDCPEKPFALQESDILIVSSDGLQSLRDGEINRILRRNRKRSSAEIAEELLDAVEALKMPGQDNTSVTVIKMLSGAAAVPEPVAIPEEWVSVRAKPAEGEATEIFDAVELDESPIALPKRAVG
ncbi:MAG: protein phosphatase 2C domain-containing protein [Pseudomonadota bacterium]